MMRNRRTAATKTLRKRHFRSILYLHRITCDIQARPKSFYAVCTYTNWFTFNLEQNISTMELHKAFGDADKICIKQHVVLREKDESCMERSCRHRE